MVDGRLPFGAAQPVDPESPSQGKPRTFAEFAARHGLDPTKPVKPPPPRYAPAPPQIQAVLNATVNQPGVLQAMRTTQVAVAAARPAPRPVVCELRRGRAPRVKTNARRRGSRRPAQVARAGPDAGDGEPEPPGVAPGGLRHVSEVLGRYLAGLELAA